MSEVPLYRTMRAATHTVRWTTNITLKFWMLTWPNSHHKALQLTPSSKLTYDQRLLIHRVAHLPHVTSTASGLQGNLTDKKGNPLGPYRRPMPRVPGGSWEVGVFLWARYVPL